MKIQVLGGPKSVLTEGSEMRLLCPRQHPIRISSTVWAWNRAHYQVKMRGGTWINPSGRNFPHSKLSPQNERCWLLSYYSTSQQVYRALTTLPPKRAQCVETTELHHHTVPKRQPLGEISSNTPKRARKELSPVTCGYIICQIDAAISPTKVTASKNAELDIVRATHSKRYKRLYQHSKPWSGASKKWTERDKRIILRLFERILR